MKKTLFYVAMLTTLCSSLAFGETEETRYFRLECEKIKEPQICSIYESSKEDETKPDNNRIRILGLDAPYPILIDKNDNLTGKLVSARRKYTLEEKKYIGIENEEYEETSELQFEEYEKVYRFDVWSVPKDKTKNSIEILFSNKDYVYLCSKMGYTPNKYDHSKTHYTYYAFDRKYKTLIELFYFRGNFPRQGKSSHPIFSKNGSDYFFKWSGVLDGGRENIYYTFSVLPNEKMDCKIAWDNCEGIKIVPRKQ